MTPLELTSPCAEETRRIGEILGGELRSGDVVLLHGDLGAGKTTLTQGIAHGLGVADSVQSPTFTLVGEHTGRGADGGEIALHHLDLYRLNDVAELESFGYDQYLDPVDAVSVIEWPERAGDWRPDRYLLVEMIADGGDRRRLRLSSPPRDERGEATIRRIAERLESDSPPPLDEARNS